jgi:heat shock protein HslJ
MRRITMAATLLAVAAVVIACSSGSGLTGKTWKLTSITEKVPAFQGVVPEADQANYTIEFMSDGKFSAKADCNQVAGAYTTTSTGGMTITPGPSTLVACPEGSMGDQYVAGLGNAASYAIASNVLTITLKDGGTLVYN